MSLHNKNKARNIWAFVAFHIFTALRLDMMSHRLTIQFALHYFLADTDKSHNGVDLSQLNILPITITQWTITCDVARDASTAQPY